MDYLMFANVLTMGFLFSIWKRGDWLNVAIKFGLLVLMVLNVLRMAGKF